MKKIILLLILLIPTNIFALNMYSSSYIVYDETDDVTVVSENENKITDIASITKIATVITAIDHISDLNEYITYTKEMDLSVESGATQVGLVVGNKYTYMDLLYGSILVSGADATNALAISIFGSIKEYCRLMNELSSELGLTNTNYENVSGMSINNHYSTASDIIKLMIYANKNDIYKTIINTNKYELSDGKIIYGNNNDFIKQVNNNKINIIGTKKGYTKKAGYTASVTFEYNNHIFDLVVLNSYPEQASGYLNIIDTSTLINYVYNNYKTTTNYEIYLSTSLLNTLNNNNVVKINIITLLLFILLVLMFIYKYNNRKIIKYLNKEEYDYILDRVNNYNSNMYGYIKGNLKYFKIQYLDQKEMKVILKKMG